MSEQTPHRPRDDDFDARFADIVSQWDIDEPIDRPDPQAPWADGPGSTTGSPPKDSATERDQQAPPAHRAHRADSPDRESTTQPEATPGGMDPYSVFARLDLSDGSIPPGSTTPNSGWRVHVPPAQPEDDFVPAPVAPLPRGDLSFWGAMVGLIAGPIWLLYLVVFHRDDGHLPMLLAILLTVAGFGLMIWRLPTRRVDDDSDDGAVV